MHDDEQLLDGILEVRSRDTEPAQVGPRKVEVPVIDLVKGLAASRVRLWDGFFDALRRGHDDFCFCLCGRGPGNPLSEAKLQPATHSGRQPPHGIHIGRGLACSQDLELRPPRHEAHRGFRTQPEPVPQSPS